MKTQTRENIVSYLRQHGRTRPYDLLLSLHVTPAALHRHLKKLLKTGVITKVGSSPLVYYELAPANTKLSLSSKDISSAGCAFINHQYLYVSPRGELLEGVKGFLHWAQNTGQTNITTLSQKYVKIKTQANEYINKSGWIDATSRFSTIFPSHNLQKVVYQDFYSLPQFGKTKLGQLVLYAKQSQNISCIEMLVNECKPIIESFIKTYSINTIAFIPPTVPRKVQLMKELKRRLQIPLPDIKLTKVHQGEIPVPQKSLSQLRERIINAAETIVIAEKKKVNRILLIDDAIGSGATMHETALKFARQNNKIDVFAYAVVGSYKGFDVIREM